MSTNRFFTIKYQLSVPLTIRYYLSWSTENMISLWDSSDNKISTGSLIFTHMFGAPHIVWGELFCVSINRVNIIILIVVIVIIIVLIIKTVAGVSWRRNTIVKADQWIFSYFPLRNFQVLIWAKSLVKDHYSTVIKVLILVLPHLVTLQNKSNSCWT